MPIKDAMKTKKYFNLFDAFGKSIVSGLATIGGLTCIIFVARFLGQDISLERAFTPFFFGGVAYVVIRTYRESRSKQHD